MKLLILTFVLSATLFGQSKQAWSKLIKLEDIVLPKNIDPQIGALGIGESGNIFIAMHRGEIFKHDGKKWINWGHGLHEPLGMHVESEHSILVVQRAELTRITDTDKDGSADSYQCVCSSWGMSGNYHEFAFGPAKAKDGSFFVALGTASNNGTVRPEIRGQWNNAGDLEYSTMKPTWASKRQKLLPRMFARVPYRGWVIKVDPKTGKSTPYASGLRTPHGIHVTPKGDLYINDNQGDWLGSSKLYKIKQGNFYGHPDSLIWTKDWNRGLPAKLPPEELNKLRTKSACYLPQGDLANSPGQIVTLPETGFGPYNGALIMGDMNQPRLVRFMPDMVAGHEQGAVISFMEHPMLSHGNSKLAVLPPSSLLIGKTHLSWAGDEGLKKLTYLNKPHLAITKVNLTKTGFLITFNRPPATEKEKVSLDGNHYTLLYSSRYGSPKIDPKPLDTKSISITGKTLEIVLNHAPQKNHIYDITLQGCHSATAGPLADTRFFYTVHNTIK